MNRRMRFGWAIMAVAIAIIVFGLAIGSIGIAQDKNQSLPEMVQELRQAFADFKETATKNAEAISAVSVTSPPVGSILAFAGPIDPQHQMPRDWMPCDGRPLQRSDYPELFAAINTIYGDGRDDKNAKLPRYDFNLPDLRGYFLRGADDQSGRDPDAATRTPPRAGAISGVSVGSIQEDTFKHHRHEVIDQGHTHAIDGGFLADGPGGYGYGGHVNGGSDIHDRHPNPVHSATTGIQLGETGSAETRPRNTAVRWIIRVK